MKIGTDDERSQSGTVLKASISEGMRSLHTLTVILIVTTAVTVALCFYLSEWK